MLPKQWATPTADINIRAIDDQTGRQKETRLEHTIHQLQNAGRFQRWEREQQQKRRDELCPNEERKAHPSKSWCTQIDDSHKKVHSP